MLRSTMYVTTPSGCRARRTLSASAPSSYRGARLNQSARSRMCRPKTEDRRPKMEDGRWTSGGREEGEAAGCDLAGDGQAAIELGQAAEMRVAQAEVEAAQVFVARVQWHAGTLVGLRGRIFKVGKPQFLDSINDA